MLHLQKKLINYLVDYQFILNFADMTYKHKLKKYNLRVSDIAEMLELKNEMTLRNSTAFNLYMRFFVRVVERVEAETLRKIQD